MTKRAVTEQDFRKEEYINKDVNDYEFRGDGKIVRKDRWSSGMNQIAHLVGAVNNGEFEIPDVIEKVEALRDGVVNRNKLNMIWYITHAEMEKFKDGEFGSFDRDGLVNFLDELSCRKTDWDKYKEDWKTDHMSEEFIAIMDKIFDEEL